MPDGDATFVSLYTIPFSFQNRPFSSHILLFTLFFPIGRSVIVSLPIADAVFHMWGGGLSYRYF
jgi:hypothetical protein